MPQVAAATIISGVGASMASGAAAGSVLGAMAVTAVASGASYALSQGGQKAATQSLTQNVTQSAGSRRIIYGERRVGGTMVHIGSSDGNKYRHFFIALAGHEVESISDIWLNDNPLSHYNRYGDKPEVTITWLDHDTGGGKAESYYDDYFTVTVNSVVYTGQIAGIVSALQAAGFSASGDFFYETNHGDETGGSYMTAVLNITVDTLDDLLTVSDTNGSMRSNISSEYPVVVRVHNGAADQSADTDAVSELEEWTTDHRLRGIAYIYVRLRYEFNAFPNGIPTMTALVKGKKDIYDPRTEAYGYSVNSALCAADYLASEKWGYGAEYDAEIKTDFLISAANACDEQVLLTDGETYESRYECHGVIDSAEDPKANLEAILSSMAGTAVAPGGVWHIRAGAYEAPTVSLDESHLRSAVTIQTKLSWSDSCNRVKGTFISADEDYQQTDFPSVTNATYLAEDNGEANWKDIALDLTTSAAMAQRIAKILLEETRQGITVEATFSLAGAFRLIVSDTCMLSLASQGWTNKVFRVVEWAFSVGDDGKLGIRMLLRETASGVYDWADGEETAYDLAANTDLPNPWYVDPVTNLSLAQSTYLSAVGTVIPGITVSWDAVTTSIVDHYLVELYLAEGADRIDFDETENLSTTFLNLTAGVAYMVVVRAVNRFAESVGSVKIGIASGQIVTVTDGVDGLSVAELLIFRRATSTPATPTGGIFAFGYNVLTPPENWSNSVPAGTDPVYVSTGFASISGVSGTDENITWAAPVKAFSDGAAGADGQAINIIFQRAASQPSTPSNSAGVPTGWYDTVGSVPAGSNPIWSSVGTRASTTSNWVWQTPVRIVVEQVDTDLIADNAISGSYSDTLASTTELHTTGPTEVAAVTVDGAIDDGTKILITASAQVYYDGNATTPIQCYLKINGAFWLSEGGSGGVTDTCKGVIVGSSGGNTATLQVAFIAETFITPLDTDITADITTYVTDNSYVSAGAILTVTELKK